MGGLRTHTAPARQSRTPQRGPGPYAVGTFGHWPCHIRTSSLLLLQFPEHPLALTPKEHRLLPLPLAVHPILAMLDKLLPQMFDFVHLGVGWLLYMTGVSCA